MKELLLALPAISAQQGEEASYGMLDAKLREMASRRKEPGSEEDKEAMKLFQEDLLPLIHQSTFCKYVYDKPRGYAGDYKTQEMIWFAHKDGGEHRYLGETPLGKILSAHTFCMENSRANIARIVYLKKQIRKSGNRIASIGCGSCIELWGLGRKFMRTRDIFLLDMDEEALAAAKSKITGTGKLVFMNQNILKFIAINREKHLLGERDLIYVIGMMDYFTVKSAKKILAALWESVAPGGTLLFTNAHPANPTRLWMEYGGEWFLCYKEEREMREMVADLDGVAEVSHHLDKFNVYHYMEVKKA
ncbi:MAG: class I SAM-dependent methyltransferase [Spirochaetaceae bacterium]|nr:MAG: class I SAM-dependent methyltransferase [Spirochaetaceae bacterium]